MSIVGTVQSFLFFALSVVVLALAAFALLDSLRRPAGAFTYAEKRTKGFWVGISALATLLAFLALPSSGGAPGGLLFSMLGAIAAGIYLADVRPAVRHYRDNRGGGSSW